MSLAQSFNNAAGSAATAQQSPHALGLTLLELTMRRKDGDSANRDINERAAELIDQGASLSITDTEHKRTPLMWASYQCRPRIISAILNKNIDVVLMRDKDNKTALELAREKKQKPAIELLEKAEAVYRAKILEEAKDVATKRTTVIRKPLSFKKKPQGQDGQK